MLAVTYYSREVMALMTANWRRVLTYLRGAQMDLRKAFCVL